MKGGIFDKKENTYTTGCGVVLRNVHSKKRCKDHPCVIHHPSNHHMIHLPTHWRFDRQLMERICPHGVGHPDPDDLAFNLRCQPWREGEIGVHGCDGCCSCSPAAESGTVESEQPLPYVKDWDKDFIGGTVHWVESGEEVSPFAMPELEDLRDADRAYANNPNRYIHGEPPTQADSNLAAPYPGHKIQTSQPHPESAHFSMLEEILLIQIASALSEPGVEGKNVTLLRTLEGVVLAKTTTYMNKKALPKFIQYHHYQSRGADKWDHHARAEKVIQRLQEYLDHE